MSVKKILSMSMVATLCCFVLLYSGCRREDAVRAAERRRSQKVREFSLKYRPKDIPSEIERVSLAEIYGTVASAYSNGQISVIRQCEALISNRVVNLEHFAYESLAGGLVKQLYDNFLLSRNLKKLEDFPSSRALSDYLEVNLALVRFIGMSSAERFGLENPVDWWEGLSLRNLREYKKKAQELGAREFEKVVDDALEKWIAIIESEKGLTRIKLRRNLPAMLVRARMVGDVSPTQVVKGVRSYALNLVNCGYTPKWLDEEFPLSPKTSGKP